LFADSSFWLTNEIGCKETHAEGVFSKSDPSPRWKGFGQLNTANNGLRDTLQKHPRIFAGVAIGVILAAVVSCAWCLARPGMGSHKAWYTDDGGKTWFADDSRKLPPFDHDGKQAVACCVYTCDGGKTNFVSYLMRLSPEGQKEVQDLIKKQQAGDTNIRLPELPMEVELPNAGDNRWVSISSPAGREMITPHSPTGDLSNLQLVDPND
jgi:hypothetical protein